MSGARATAECSARSKRRTAIATCALVAASVLISKFVCFSCAGSRTASQLGSATNRTNLSANKLFQPASTLEKQEGRYSAHSSGLEVSNFDPQAYLDYNPDVRKALNTSQAAQHFERHGRKEQRLHTRIPVVFTYLTWGGLCNQVYAHLAAVILAAELGADLVVPPALKRNSYASVFTGNASTNTAKYTMTPFSSLFDQEKLFGNIRDMGIGVYEAPIVDQTNKSSPAYMFWDGSGLHQDHLANAVAGFGLQNQAVVLVEVDTMFNKRWLLADLKQRILAAVVNATRNRTARAGFGNDRHPPVVVVDLRLPLFSLTLRGLPQARPALWSLDFAPPLTALADEIVQRMISGGHIVSERGFNGLHLRTEKDNAMSHKMAGGMKAFMDATYSTCKLAGLNTSMPLYVATGLLTYESKDSLAWTAVEAKLRKSYCSRVLHKEMFLSKGELQTLDSEQLAAVDFLVMARCDRFVGYALSTWSLLMREYRQLHGLAPRGRNWLMQATAKADMQRTVTGLCKAACLE